MNIGRNVLIWLVILVVGLVVLQGLFGNSLTSSSSKVAISQFEELVDQGQVREVVIEGSTATGTTAAGRRFAAEIPPGGMELFLSKLDDAGTTYEYSPPSGFAFGQLFAYLLPIPLRAFVPAGGVAVQVERSAIAEAPLPSLVALLFTAACCVGLFFFPQALYELAAAVSAAGGNDGG